MSAIVRKTANQRKPMKKRRKILLIEPRYRNKYPPIGLMKIATYHRLLGDDVTFYKGEIRNLVLDQLTEDCIERLGQIDRRMPWPLYRQYIRDYLYLRKTVALDKIDLNQSKYASLLSDMLRSYADIYRKQDYARYPKWDRVYVTTLFTFYWKITVETIEDAKHLVRNEEDLHVGGVLASLLHKEIEAETGIKPHQGLLDKPGILDPHLRKAKNIVVDDLPLDYSILDEIDYEYPTGSAYFTFMTKGCTRKCAFCSVPILEPTYKPKIATANKFDEIKKTFGEQQNLLLMDNNVLASPNFPEIIQEIKSMGFYKGASMVPPNELNIAIRNLRNRVNDKAYVKKAFNLHQNILKRLKGEVQQKYYDTLGEYNLLRLETTTKKQLLAAHKELKPIFEKYRLKAPRRRHVDFNQGTDARYVTEETMRLMSEIPIKPLRLAFDYWGIRDKYENAVRLAAKYGILDLSNYLLYNFKDSPDELYMRMALNVKLNRELGTRIFSFPMKYVPLFGEDAKSREYIGPKWNKKFIRAIQSVLNVTKGIVAPGGNFFEKAFGQTIQEFNELLYMPETYIIYRKVFDTNGKADEWRRTFRNLNVDERSIAEKILQTNDHRNFQQHNHDRNLKALFQHYDIDRDNALVFGKIDPEYIKIKVNTERMIKIDRFKNLTLTYDFEPEAIGST